MRVLNFISQHYPEIRVSYINLADSIVNELLDQNVERIMVDKSIILPENPIIITHPNYYYRIPKIKTKNLFFLFWALHIDEFIR